MRKKYLTKSSSATKRLGKILAKEVLNNSYSKKAIIIGLMGDLGGGKTTFSQGFAKGLLIREKVLSPTFVLMKKFKVRKFRNFYHIDCYRIKKSEEILNLGLKEIISDPKNIVVIEWVDRITKVLPKNIIMVRFKIVDQSTREISVSGL